MSSVAYALLATISATASLLLLSRVMQVWPVGLAGILSRLVTTLILGLWIIIGSQSRWRRLRWKGQGRGLLLMGVVSLLINVCLFLGMRWTTATNGALLYRMDLLFVILIGQVLGLERINRAGWLIMPLMLTGMALLMQVQHMNLHGHARGDILVVTAAFGYAANAFIIRRILQHLDELVVAFYNYLLSGLGFGIVAVGQGFQMPAAASAHLAPWGALLALGAAGAVSLPLYYAALHRMPVWKLRVFMLLSPLMAATADWLLWRHHLHGMQWCGAGLLLGGAVALILNEARADRRSGDDLKQGLNGSRDMRCPVEPVPPGDPALIVAAQSTPGNTTAGAPSAVLPLVRMDH
jgi:drug/metabolite transporter (DMT)-like permease